MLSSSEPGQKGSSMIIKILIALFGMFVGGGAAMVGVILAEARRGNMR